MNLTASTCELLFVLFEELELFVNLTAFTREVSALLPDVLLLEEYLFPPKPPPLNDPPLELGLELLFALPLEFEVVLLTGLELLVNFTALLLLLKPLTLLEILVLQILLLMKSLSLPEQLPLI